MALAWFDERIPPFNDPLGGNMTSNSEFTLNFGVYVDDTNRPYLPLSWRGAYEDRFN